MPNPDFITAVQKLMQSWGEPLPKYGADGHWGSESDAAFERLKLGVRNPGLELPDDYLSVVSRIESNDTLFAKNPKSSASGLFQFIESTWKAYGGKWGSVGGLAFGGLKPSRAEQEAIMRAFTTDNAKVLQANGVRINTATLYAAHFLGAGKAARILKMPGETPIEAVTTEKERRANPSVLRGTVGDFRAWLSRKTGVQA